MQNTIPGFLFVIREVNNHTTSTPVVFSCRYRCARSCLFSLLFSLFLILPYLFVVRFVGLVCIERWTSPQHGVGRVSTSRPSMSSWPLRILTCSSSRRVINKERIGLYRKSDQTYSRASITMRGSLVGQRKKCRLFSFCQLER